MKIIVPTSWSDVTLEKYIALKETMDVPMEDLDKQVAIISVLTGIDTDKIMELSFSDLKTLIVKTDFIYSLPEKAPIRQYIKLAKQKYSIEYDARKLTAGEYITISNFTKDKDQINSNLASIMAVYLKPVNYFGRRQKGYYKKNLHGEYEQTMESMERTTKALKSITMDKVFPISAFFLNRWHALMEATQDYLENQVTKSMKNVKKQLKKAGLQNIGDGILH